MCRKSSKDGDPRLPDWAPAIKGLQAMPAPSLLLLGCLVCSQAPQQVVMGKVAFGTGPHGSGRARCLLCPLDPPFPLPSEFFPLTQITTKTPLPLTQQRAEHQHFCTSVHWEYRASPRLCPQCLSHTSSTAFAKLKGFSLLKAP